MDKTLTLVRHAHRDKAQGRAFDDGLSQKGLAQARKISRRFALEFGDARSVAIFSSPKKRCLETVGRLLPGARITVSADLDEGGDCRAKALRFIENWKDSPVEVTVACSHGDWLRECLLELVGAEIEMMKGAWAEVVLKDGRVRLTWLLQKL